MDKPATTTVDTTASESEAEFAKLLAQAKAEDEGRPAPSGEDAPDSAKNEDGADVTKDKSPTASDDEAKAKAAEKAKADKPDTKEKKTEPDQPGEKSPFMKDKEARQKAEEDRRNKSWQKLEEDRAAFRNQVEQFQREREEFTRSRAPVKTEPLKDGSGRTADDYDKAAKDFRGEGDEALAKIAEARAKELRDKEAATARPAQPAYDRNAEIHEAMEADPELRKNDNPVVVQANDLMNNPATRDFFARRGGVAAAIQVGQLRVKAAQVDELQKKNEELTAEVQRLTKATSVTGAPAQEVTGKKKSFEEMSSEEQLKELERLAREADGI